MGRNHYFQLAIMMNAAFAAFAPLAATTTTALATTTDAATPAANSAVAVLVAVAVTTATTAAVSAATSGSFHQQMVIADLIGIPIKHPRYHRESR